MPAGQATAPFSPTYDERLPMGFPTSDEIASSMEFLQLSGLQHKIVAARPELKAVTSVRETGPLVLTLELPPSHFGYHNRVVIAWMKNRLPHWLICGSRQDDLLVSVWEHSTDEDHLRDAILATYDACLAKSGLASPWRWAEPERTAIVQVADALSGAGMEVEAVASRNRLVPDPIEGNDRPKSVVLKFGDAIRIQTDWGSATLARKPTLGWVLDANDTLLTRRLDLGYFATGERTSSPGYMTEDPRHLADVVKRAIRDGRWEATGGHLDVIELWSSASPLHEAVAQRMRELGYPRTSVAWRDTPEIVMDEFMVGVGAKRCGIGHVQRAFAEATVQGRKLMMFSTEGYTRDAIGWANRASVPLFIIYGEDYRLSAASLLADEHLPQMV